MLESFTQSLGGAAGTILLVVLLPMTCAIGIGLVVVGLMRRRYGAVIGGLILPFATLGVGLFMRQSAIDSPDAPPNIEEVLKTIESILPFGLLLAGALFLVAVVPVIFKVARSR